MTRPNQSALVLDGETVKLRLQAERSASGSAVHVDWLRFTVARRNLPAPSVDELFPLTGGDAGAWDKAAEVARHLASVPDCDTDLYSQAKELGEEVSARLGREFAVNPEARKGHDFYKHRLSIERNGSEVGWVGFGASSESPRQQAQAKTLHVNVYGEACTFAEHGWAGRMADFVDARAGTITRCDLALDFFEGYSGGIERVADDFEAGRMAHRGKNPSHNVVGPWRGVKHTGRSFYFGSKEAGKQTNVYEKGDQLFGVEARSPWLRVELRWGNKLRELCSDMLRRPADFFACASDWHAQTLAEVGAEVAAAAVPCKRRAADENVFAAFYRSAKHFAINAGPSLGALLRFAPQEFLNECASVSKLPKSLQRFSASELEAAGARLFMVPKAEGFGPSFVSP